MATKVFVSASASTIPGGVPAISDAEIAFFNRAETVEWWDAKPDNGQHVADRGHWEGRKAGYKLSPVTPSRLPVYSATGGPDSQPVLNGLTTGMPAETLLSAADDIAIPTGSFCLWAVAKSGTTSGATAMGAVGNDGGALTMRLRGSDLAQVQAYSASSSLTRISQTLSAASYHLMQLNYDHVGHVLSLWANGVLLSGLTPAGGTFEGYTHGFATHRLSLFSAFDLVDGDYDQPARSLSIAMAGVGSTHAPDNSAWQDALEAMVDERFPSIGL